MVYISHLDMQRMFQRAFRRAGAAFAFSQGFNPHPKMTYSPPLPLFTASDEEYLDVALVSPLDIATLHKALPDGVVINSARLLGSDDKPLSEMISTAAYEITIRCANAEAVCQALSAAYNGADALTAEKRDKKKRLVQKDIRPLVKSAAFDIADGRIVIRCELSLKNDTLLNPHRFISALFSKAFLDEKACDIDIRKVKTFP